MHLRIAVEKQLVFWRICGLKLGGPNFKDQDCEHTTDVRLKNGTKSRPCHLWVWVLPKFFPFTHLHLFFPKAGLAKPCWPGFINALDLMFAVLPKKGRSHIRIILFWDHNKINTVFAIIVHAYILLSLSCTQVIDIIDLIHAAIFQYSSVVLVVGCSSTWFYALVGTW